MGVYGDVWPRLLALGVRTCPWFFEPLLVGIHSVLFYLACGPARSALLANLAVLFPGEARASLHWRALRVIWNFAWSMVDAAHARNGEDMIEWEVEGADHLKAIAGTTGGAIILTAHMGSYDVAAPMFGRRLKRRLHMVRAPERQPESQAYAKSQRDQQTAGQCVIHYNEPGNMLAVKLAALLRENEIVAIQGDRILFDVAGHTLPFSEEQDWVLPKGPFLLGLVSRAPLLPLFITRSGWRRYRVTALAPCQWPEGRLDKEQALNEAGAWWSRHLAAMVHRHWDQWFVFEPVFNKHSSSP